MHPSTHQALLEVCSLRLTERGHMRPEPPLQCPPPDEAPLSESSTCVTQLQLTSCSLVPSSHRSLPSIYKHTQCSGEITSNTLVSSSFTVFSFSVKFLQMMSLRCSPHHSSFFHDLTYWTPNILTSVPSLFWRFCL